MTLRAANGPPVEGGVQVHLSSGALLDPNEGLVLHAGDSLSGSGTISGGLVNHGHLNPGHSPGLITIETDFTQGPEGTTTIEIGGTAGPGVNPNGHDQINVLGDIHLDGTVEIQLFNGFVPSAGQTFVIFHWGGTRTGSIANWLGTAGIPGNPNLAFVHNVDDGTKTITLTVVSTPLISDTVESALNQGLTVLRDIGTALEGVGEFAEDLPLIGGRVGDWVDIGQALQQTLLNQLTDLDGTPPFIRQSQITSLIESWDGTTVGGLFEIKVNGVLGHYGAVAADPFWWEVNLEITLPHLNEALSNLTGAVLGAVFDPAPTVTVRGTLELDFGFGYASGFFVLLDSLTGRVTVDASGLGDFGFDFPEAPGGLVSLDVTGWSVLFEAHVTATPDPSILNPQGRILQGTLEQILGLSPPPINISDAFNLAEGGSVDASFTLETALDLFGLIESSSTNTVRIESADIFGGNDPDLTVVINGNLSVLGQTISGVFTFKKTASETILEMAGGVLDLNAGPVRVVRLTDGTGKFLLLGGDLAGSASLTIAAGPTLPNIDISGSTLSLRFNTASEAVSTIDGEAVDLPAGDYYRLAGNAVMAVGIPEVDLTGDFVFEPRDADSNTANGYEDVAVGVANLSLQFDAGGVALLDVTSGSGAFLFTEDGLLGWATATVSMLVPGINLSGAFSLTLNETNAGFGPLDLAVNGTTVTIPVLPPGPYVRVTAGEPDAPATLEILGLELSGIFVLEQKTTADADDVVTVGFSEVQLPLGTVTADLLTVSDISGAFIITDQGVAGQGTIGTVRLGVPGVANLTGSFSLRVNTTPDPVNETVDVVGSSEVINVPGGPYLQIRGSGVSLDVLGVSLEGDFSFEQRTTQDGTRLVTLLASNVTFDFGTDLITLTEGEALFLITDGGMAGQGSITASISAFGLGFSHTFNWSFNNTGAPVSELLDTAGMGSGGGGGGMGLGDVLENFDLPAGPFNRIDTNGPVTIEVPVAGQTQSITAELVLTLVDDPAGDFVTIGASSLSTTLGAVPLTLLVSGGTGAFVLNDDGLAGIVTVTSATLGGVSDVGVTASSLRLELNNTGADVDVPVRVSEDPAEDVRVQFTGAYFHDYLAVAGIAELDLDGFVTLTGDFRFEKSGASTFKVGAAGMMFSLQAGSLNVISLRNGTGAFILTADGLAGVADVEFEVGLVGISGDISLEVNTTSAAVNTSVTIPNGAGVGVPTAINLTQTDYLRLYVDGQIQVGSFSLPFDFTVAVETGTGDVVLATNEVTPQELVRIDSDGNIDLSGPLSSLTDLDFAISNPFEFVSMLRQLLNWLEIFRDSDLFEVEIPFTDGATLGDVFNWSQVFMDKIYSSLVSVELQSTSIFAATTRTGALSGAKLKLQIGDETPVELTVNDTIGSANFRDGDELVDLINNAIDSSTLDDRIEARLNKDDRLVIALLPAEIAAGRGLKLVDLDSKIEGLGFGPRDGTYGDANDTTAEQVALETERFTTEQFFPALADLLNDDQLDGDGGVTYEEARRVYTYLVSKELTYSTGVDFDFGEDLGDLAGASLSGKFDLVASAGFNFTLGFDLGPKEVPRILSSSLVPVPANGRISENATFQVRFNNDTGWTTVVLPKSYTDGTDPLDLVANNTIADLATDLNRALANTTYSGSGVPGMTGQKLNQMLYAQKAGNLLAISALEEVDHDGDGLPGTVHEDSNGNGILDLGEDLDMDGILDRVEDLNRDGTFDHQLGAINRVTIRARQDNAFATEIGFGIEAVEDLGVSYFQSASTATIKGLFVEGISLDAELSITPVTPIDGSVRFGFVEVSTTGGVLSTPTPIRAEVSLVNSETGDSRLYVSELMSSLASINVARMIQGPDFSGSLLVRLPNITVGGLGFTFPLGGSPEVSVFIPDINNLEFNPDPYDGTNTGIFLTYPDLGHLTEFSGLNFTQIIQALNVLADSLSQLSAFSFLNEPLPLINVSINDLVDYATKFAELVEEVASGNAQSLQQSLAELETQIELLFDLDPSVLSVDLDTLDTLTAGAVNGVSPATATINPGGYNNGIIFTSTASNTSFNNVNIRYISDPDLTGNNATVTWDAAHNILTIRVNGGVTTADTVVAMVNALVGTPWNAVLLGADNPTSGNTGDGTFTTTALQFSFVFTTGYADTLPFQLDLKDLVSQLAGQNATAAAFLDAVTDFIQVQGSGSLTVSASATLTLDFGLDLTDPDAVRPFFYDSTGVVLNAKVLGSDIEFSATVGAVAGIKVKEGTVTLDKDGNPDTDAGTGDRGAEFRLGLRDNNGDGRHYFSEDWLDFDNIDLHMEGGVSAVLPVFLNVAGSDLPLGSDADGNSDSYPDNYLVIDIPDLVRLFVDTQAQPNTLGQGVATLRLPGANNDLTFTRTAGDSDNFTLTLTQNSGLGTGASATFAGNTLNIQINSGSTTAQAIKDHFTSNPALAGFTVDSPTPDDPAGGNSGAGKATTSKLILITPDLASLFADLDICDVINQNADLLLDGLDALLGMIQDGLEAVAYSVRLPLIGDGFAGAANFIEDFRSGLLADLRKEIKEAGSATAAIENAIKKAFWNLLGPPGLDILADVATGNPLDPSGGYQQLDVRLTCDDGLKVNLRLKKEAALVDTSENPIDLDIGVPGFGLEVEGNVKLAVGFDLKFGFGFNKEDGFFFDSSAPASAPELRIYIEATIPGLTATGTLLFLQLQVSDDPDAPSHFTGEFVVDLMDPNHDDKLTFAELTSSGTDFEDIIHADLAAVADLNLDLSASFGGNTAFPRVLAEFHLDWSWSVEDGASEPTVSFTNIYLDLGTFLSDFLGPILKKIQEVTAPFQPIVDAATARLPIFSDLAGEKITLLDLAEVFGLLEPSTVDFINSVLEVVTLINSLDGLGEGSILIPFGSFSLGTDSSGQRNKIQALQQAAALTGQALEDAIASAGAASGASETFISQSAGFAGDVGSLDNFSIPIFDNPAELFNIFIGEPVRLVEWRLPQFKFEFTYTQKIPIYPPLYAQFGGRIGATIDIGFGYDTFGIQKFIESEDKNVLDILDGFYVIDFDTAGNDRPELTLSGELFAGASIDLFIVSVGVNGGIFARVEFDLNDINNDGKIRVSEIVALAEIDPRCIFNIHGEIGLFLEAFLKVDLFFFSIEKTWRFAEITLFEFDLTCPEPVLANIVGGDLHLNIGKRAGDRKDIDTSDTSETFVVKHVDGGPGSEIVEIQWGNFRKEFTGFNRIIVEDAGDGDDYLDFRGVVSTIEVNGGVGNDTIYLGDGSASVAHGGAGNDTLIASSSDTATLVVLHGDDGNDTLTAGSVAIEIHGGAGNDTITGSPESDNPATFGGLYGDEDTDTINAGDGDDYADGGTGNDTLDAGAGNDFVLGGAGNDALYGRRGDDILEGGDGDDNLEGSSGHDLLIGGLGSDRLNGHGGIDVLVGDNVGSIKVGATAVNQTNISTLLPLLGDINQVGLTLSALELTGDGDTDTANDGDDLLIGGGNIDVLFGGEGDDFLYGGNLFNGTSEVIEEDHNDFFDGGPGNDVIFGDDALGRTGDRNTGIAIKSSIFFDSNENGRRDEEETGFGGVTVELFSVSAPLTPIDAVITEPDGAFQFLGLDPGDYILEFSGLPTGLSFTLQYAPATSGGTGATGPEDDDADSDANPVSGRTDPVHLDFDETESAVAAGFKGPAKVSVANASVNEGNSGPSALVFTITLSHFQGAPVEVQYRTNNLAGPLGASTADGDYQVTTGTVVFNPGELSKQITVLVNGDTTYEEHQQFALTILRAQRMEETPVDLQVTNASIRGTIINDDPIPQISIADYVPPSTVTENGVKVYLVGEGENARFVITLSNPSQYDITVYYRSDAAYGPNALPLDDAATPDGLGVSFPDFELVTDVPLVFQAGQVRKEIEVKVFDEAEKGLAPLDEADETFFVDLYNSVNARIADGRAYGIIPDDDQPVSVSIRTLAPYLGNSFLSRVTEGNSLSVFIDLVVELHDASGLLWKSGRTVTVTYATSPGTAVETVFSGDTDGDGVVDVFVLATPDYVGLPNDNTPEELSQLVFAPGENSKPIRIEVLADNWVEGDEMFFVNLLSAENAEIARLAPAESNHVTIEIEENDIVPGVDVGPWSIRFSDVSYRVTEPETGVVDAVITLIRNPGSSNSVAVFYTEDGTATSGGVEPDYDSVFRQLVVFGPHEYSKTVTVRVHADDNVEVDETVRLYLRAPTGQPTTAYPNQATLVIKDQDTPRMWIEPPTINFTITFPLPIGPINFSIPGIEEGSGLVYTDKSFTVHLSAPAGPGGVFVDYETVSLTARHSPVGTRDYIRTTSTLFIPAGVSQGTIDIPVYEDTRAELSETFAVRLSHPLGATLAPEDSAAVATIYDDDTVEIFGLVFFDNNGNGFRDAGEKSIKNVEVDITHRVNGVEVTDTVLTDQLGPGGDWVYKLDVFLGQVSIAVNGESVESPYQGLFAFLLGSGNYATTTNNENQAVIFDGIQGISPFAPVGYKNSFKFAFPAASDDVGRGGTDDMLFGGPGNDVIDAGAGDDHVVGGHWMTATDGNAPVNKGDYDAVITLTNDPANPQEPGSTPPLHNVFDQGPIFSVDTSGLGPYGTISGQIWFDTNDDGVQQGGEPLFTLAGFLEEVIVHLYDGKGNQVNSLVTTDGTYTFQGIPLDPGGAVSQYVVQFELPKNYKFAKQSPAFILAVVNNDAYLGGRTGVLSVSTGTPNRTNIDAGLRPSDMLPTSGTGGFEFDDPSYSVNENDPAGYVTVIVVRGDSTQSRAVIVRTEEGTAHEVVNYDRVSILLNFEVGETFKAVQIPIHDSGLDFTSTVYFKVVLRDPTGRPLGETIVHIFGDGAGTITDDDTIQGGDDWDVIIGDSGYIPANTIPEITSVAGIVFLGGPGKDVINGGNSLDYINGQLGKDILAGNAGRDIVFGDLGDDVIIVERADDISVGETINGGHGFDTVISDKDVALIQLITTGATTADLYHKDSSGSPLSLFKLTAIENAHLFGGFQSNTFDIQDWAGSAIIAGRQGNDTLLVSNDLSSMILRDATFFERILFQLFFGVSKDAAVSLPNGSTYHLSSLEKVVLTGKGSANKLDASGYSQPVTLIGAGGDDELIGGSAGDTFVFDADGSLGTDTVTGNGGADTLYFGKIQIGTLTYETLAGLTVNLTQFDNTTPPLQVVVPGNLSLKLKDALENVTGGSGSDNITGNDLNNVLVGGPGNDTLAGGPGNERYVYDTDLALILEIETIIEFSSDLGHDILDFSGITTQQVSLNLAILGTAQTVTPFLQLQIVGEGVEEVLGGALNDILRGNSSNNTLRGGPGSDILDGNSGDDVLDGGPGNDDLDGGEGLFDTINETANTNFILTNTSLTRGTLETDILDNIEVANLTGGSSANTFTLTGWTGSGIIRGRGGFDTVILSADANFILSDSALSATPGLAMGLSSIENAILSGGPSGNTFDLSGFTGNTRITAGEGNDTIHSGAGSDQVFGGLGLDTLIRDLSALPSAAAVVLQNNGLLVTWEITTGSGDVITLGELDLLDSVEAVQLTATPNNDTIDISAWTAGAISIDGGAGLDILQATVNGVVTLTDTAVTLGGGTGSIAISGIEAAILIGSDGDDLLNAAAFSGVVWLQGRAGNDILVASRGTLIPAFSILDGQDGDDLFLFVEDGALDRVLVRGGEGEDTLSFGGDSDLGLLPFTTGVTVNLSVVGLLQTVAVGELELRLMAEDLENVIGGDGADSLTGNSLDNTLTGGRGADIIDGSGGFNTLRETADANFVLTDASLDIAGSVDALFNIQQAFLTGGAGDNTLNASAFTGRATLRGEGGNDTLLGGTGDTLFIGGAGKDFLSGNTGSDTYEWDVDESLGEDTVDDAGGLDLFDFRPTTDQALIVNLDTVGAEQTVHATHLKLTLTLTTVIEFLIGGDQTDFLTGNSADNGFWGGGGDDLIDGGGGTNFVYENRDADMVLSDFGLQLSGLDADGDTYTETDSIVNIQLAILEGGEGANTLDASAFSLGSVSLSGGAGDDILIGSRNGDDLQGQEGNDLLLGGAGNDTLEGGDGDDTLNGGAEDAGLGLTDDDTLRGGNGNDTYVFDLSLVTLIGPDGLPITPLDLGTDTVEEQAPTVFNPNVGYHDVLIGVGLAGLAVDLFDTGPQDYTDDTGVIRLTLILVNAGTVEDSF